MWINNFEFLPLENNFYTKYLQSINPPLLKYLTFESLRGYNEELLKCIRHFSVASNLKKCKNFHPMEKAERNSISYLYLIPRWISLPPCHTPLTIIHDELSLKNFRERIQLLHGHYLELESHVSVSVCTLFICTI